jgi:hypothetical protein
MKMVSETSMPYDVLVYDRSIMMIVDAYYRAGAMDKARKIVDKMVKNISDEVKYFHSLKESYQGGSDLYLVQQNLSVLNYLANSAAQNGDEASAKKWNQTLQTIAQGIPAPARQ